MNNDQYINNPATMNKRIEHDIYEQRHANIDCIYRFYEAVTSLDYSKTIFECFTTDATIHTNFQAISARDYLLTGIEQYHKAFPGFTIELCELHSHATTAFVRWKAHGVHLHPFMEIEPSGELITLNGSHSFCFSSPGKIQELWLTYDILSMTQELAKTTKKKNIQNSTSSNTTNKPSRVNADDISNKTIETIQQYFTDLTSIDYSSKLLPYFTDDAVMHTTVQTLPLHKHIIPILSEYHKAFPGYTMKVLKIIPKDHKLVVHWCFHGIHRNSYMGVKASGYPFSFRGNTVFLFNDQRKIQALWEMHDQISFIDKLEKISRYGKGYSLLLIMKNRLLAAFSNHEAK